MSLLLDSCDVTCEMKTGVEKRKREGSLSRLDIVLMVIPCTINTTPQRDLPNRLKNSWRSLSLMDSQR